MNKNIGIGVLSVLVVVLGVLAFKAPSVVSVPTDIKLDLSQLGSQKAPVVNVAAPEVVVRPNINVPELKLGAVSSISNVTEPNLSINNVREFYYSQNTIATSSAVCSILNPFNATTSILSYAFEVVSNGLGAQTFDLSTSSTHLASSSPALIRAATIPAGRSTAFWVAPGGAASATVLSAATNGRQQAFLKPGEYLNIVLATSSPGTFGSYLTGTCKAVLQSN